MGIFDDRFKHVSVRLWNDLAPGKWPETTDSDVADSLAARDNIGIAFSGGGTRAASATLGQLRALSALGWLDRVRYVAAVSGGAWTAVPFAFLPTRTQDETFLGPLVEPGDITKEILDDLDINGFAYTISQSGIADELLRNVLAGDELFSRVIGEVFLKPVSIEPNRCFFVQDAAARDALLCRNAGLTERDFVMVRPGRPFLIATGTVLRSGNKDPSLRRFRFDMTPLYVGLRELFPNAGSKGRPIGGGFVESPGFDSDAPEASPVDSVIDVRLGSRHRFTLSDVVGTTGAAPAWALAKLGLDFVGFPEFKYWSPSTYPFPEDKDYEFGDGGNLENLGIMPLLARKVERLLVFVNTNHPLVPGQIAKVADSLPPLFGRAPDGFMLNKVFDPDRFEPLLKGLWSMYRDGEPAWYREVYRVQENALHGVEGDWNVDVTWIYLQMPTKWRDALQPEVSTLIGRGELTNFPHYETFFQNERIIDLSARQVSLLAHMTAWAATRTLANSGAARVHGARRMTRRAQPSRRRGRGTRRRRQ